LVEEFLRYAQAAKLFVKGAVFGLCVSLFALLFDFGLFYTLRTSYRWSRNSAVEGFVLFTVFESVFMLILGFSYGQRQRIVMLHDAIFTQYQTSVEYPHRPLVSLTLIVAGVLLLLLMVFVVPQTMLNLL